MSFSWKRKLIVTYTHTHNPQPSQCLKCFTGFLLLLGYNPTSLLCGLQDPAIFPALPPTHFSKCLLTPFSLYSLWTSFNHFLEPALPPCCPGSLHKQFLLSGVFSPSRCHLVPLQSGCLDLNGTSPGVTDTTSATVRSIWFHSPQRRGKEVSGLHPMVRWISMSSVHSGAQAGTCEHTPSGPLRVLLPAECQGWGAAELEDPFHALLGAPQR